MKSPNLLTSCVHFHGHPSTLWQTNIAGWNIPIFNRKYIWTIIPGPFSSNRYVRLPECNCSWTWRNPHFPFTTVDGWNPANQLRLVVFPIIYRVSYIPGGAGFHPSTVGCPWKWTQLVSQLGDFTYLRDVFTNLPFFRGEQKSIDPTSRTSNRTIPGHDDVISPTRQQCGVCEPSGASRWGSLVGPTFTFPKHPVTYPLPSLSWPMAKL